MLGVYAPQAERQPEQGGRQRDPVRRAVAVQAVRAVALAAGQHDAVAVVHGAVDEVEDVAAEDGGEAERAPAEKKGEILGWGGRVEINRGNILL